VSARRVKVGRAYTVRATKLRRLNGNAAIPSDGVVLSGNGDGARALEAVWSELRAETAAPKMKLRVDSDYRESIGGHPKLMTRGVEHDLQWSYFTASRSPRTAVGWNEDSFWLVQVDGRRSASIGWTMYEAQNFMRALGADEALNLDGGGSSTFVARGQVRNHPSDGRERWTSTALAIVPV